MENQVRLNCGVNLPIFGFGTFSYQAHSKAIESAVHMAIKMGHRHFDTATIYGSEGAVGKAICDEILSQDVGREDIFITTKVWGNDHHDPVSALKQSLRNMGLEYIDMYLVHWPLKLKPWACYPVPKESDFEEALDLESTWKGMEKCQELGLCRCIGVSNFSTKKLESLLEFASIPPAVNQVEMHPMWRQRKLREFCGEHKIHVSAYSPLGGPGNAWGSTAVIESPLIKSIALKHNATPAQVALQWGLSKGSSVIVKSFNEHRMKENFGALDLKLDDQDCLEIEKLEERKIMRGEYFVNDTTSPFKIIQDLWDGEI
ncbi:NADPH-dependent aldo-keto reductase, chloroplastic [Cucurbita pepo subsp. pepo]|uniref:NADPH-dependent aldo-keto reductase, chloroplastic n=1 Tax=Cucurbita pepo subsp. pepo TaxID=3664 RepID=UPI000C9D4AEB|nr:NADPH-dependent aldo-keto reductase, chloroplastic [Cucurbita pepo subsp. pepo]